MPDPTGAAVVSLHQLIDRTSEGRDVRAEDRAALAQRVARAKADAEVLLRRANSTLEESQMLVAESRRRLAARGRA